MDQHSRTRIINDFKSGKLRVLVATDVAARGAYMPGCLPHAPAHKLSSTPPPQAST
jgi:hypothetical protein